MLHSLAENSRVVIAGAGNLATCLGEALVRAGVVPSAVWSRSDSSASQLAAKLGCPYTTCIQSLPDADIVITAVSDDALGAVARELVARYSDALLVHTAGSVPMKLWAEASASRYGVFYPMQTFSKGKSVDFGRLGIFLEACDEAGLMQLENLARRLTPMVCRATSEQRAFLHIAAVFVCNFTNAMYRMAAELLEKEGLPFEAMLPLIDETAAKLHHLAPADAQTGPAARGDNEIVARQSAVLDGVYRDVYDLVSRYISEKREK